MDLVIGELRTVSEAKRTDPKTGVESVQQKIQVLSDSSQFGGEFEESITLYVPAVPSLEKLKKRILRIPVTTYAKAGVVHRNFWKDAPVAIEIQDEKGDFVPLSNRLENIKPATKTG